MIVAGTGHRPNKLGGYNKEAHQRLVTLAHSWLLANRRNITGVISGGALGWDQALAEAAIRLRIPLTMALPFLDFASKWPDESRIALSLLCDWATDVVYVSPEGYAPYKMQLRNEWMVNEADQVLALWDGSDGGTANCVRYAQKVGKPIVNLWKDYEQQKAQLQEPSSDRS